MMTHTDSASALMLLDYGQDDSDEELDTSVEKEASKAEKDVETSPPEKKSPDRKRQDSGKESESPARRISSGLISDEEIDHHHAAERFRKRKHEEEEEEEDDEGSSGVPAKVAVPDVSRTFGQPVEDDVTDILPMTGMPKSEKRSKQALKGLVSYGADQDDEDEESESEEEEEDENSNDNVDEVIMQENARASPLVSNDLDNIQLPPEPPGKCSKRLQEKIKTIYAHTLDGYNINDHFQNMSSFRNPSIYEKLIQTYKIDENGSNFSLDVYNPHIWTKDSFYDELDKLQKKDMERREKERKTKIEFISGTRKSAPSSSDQSSSGASDDKKRKSKWDALPPGLPTQGHRSGSSGSGTIGVANLTSVATGSRATVISAVGTLSKKPTFSVINNSAPFK